MTAVPVAATAFFVWTFIQLASEEVKTFSAEATDVARTVLEDLDCDAVRANDGRTTTDLRARGERRYHVRITWGCATTRVLVLTEDGKAGTAAAPRNDCCAARPAS
jgi:hypothetical protein